jgi:multidrug transporter EmrE-like cation transporter
MGHRFNGSTLPISPKGCPDFQALEKRGGTCQKLMAIYTPRGLKIRLPTDYAFTLIARLYPRVDAFEVLKTTEGLESLPQAFAFATGLISFLLKLSPVQIGLAVFVVTVAIATMTRYGLYIFPNFVKVGTVYSHISGFGILLIVLCGLGFFLVDWKGVLAFFIARLFAGVMNLILNWRETNYYYSELGDAITASERNFINAYRLHASRLGITIDVAVSEEEMNEGKWQLVLTDLAWKWPKVVDRFTPD